MDESIRKRIEDHIKKNIARGYMNAGTDGGLISTIGKFGPLASDAKPILIRILRDHPDHGVPFFVFDDIKEAVAEINDTSSKTGE